jgi:hypothetical protein
MKTSQLRSYRKRLLAFGIALLFLLSTYPPRADAALVRGRLVRVAPNGQVYGVPGVSVTVYRQDLGRSTPSVTDGNGMYYLTVPAGAYWLEVWVTNPPRVYQIQVFEPGTDIPPIFV